MSELLRVERLSVSMPGPDGAITIVDQVALSVESGEVLGVAGESGSGKTITALSLMGLQPPAAVVTGTALLNGRDLLQLSKREMQKTRGRQIAMIFQDPMTSLHPMLTVERQITEHMRQHLGIGRDDAHARAISLLERVRIPDPEHALSAHPHQFSGGMRQRIAIAMALSCEPKLLIADEPTTALDVTVQAGILHLLSDLCRDRKMAVILVTHDLGVMSSVANRLSIFYAGRIVESGPTLALLSRPRHPYTELLLRALPDPEDTGQPLKAIPGEAVTPERRPPGCALHPRCPYAEPTCSQQVPALIPIGTNRSAACPVDPLADAQPMVTDPHLPRPRTI